MENEFKQVFRDLQIQKLYYVAKNRQKFSASIKICTHSNDGLQLFITVENPYKLQELIKTNNLDVLLGIGVAQFSNIN